jgi:hypothetical protein
MTKLTEYNNVIIDDCVYDIEDLLGLYKLQKQLLEKEKIVATLKECIDIWQGYSNDLHASWLFIDSEDLVKSIKSNSSFESFEAYLNTKL